MLSSLTAAPGLGRAFAASVIARLPTGAIGLLLILHTRDLTGSYAAGGIVAGANALGHGIGGPLIGRIVDRRGQTGVIVWTAVVFAASLSAYALLPESAPLAAAIACAAVAGASHPPIGAAIRALWSAKIDDPDKRHAAFALESAVFELVYIAGPLLLVGLIGVYSLPAAAFAAAGLALAGSLWFASSSASRDWLPDPARSDDRAGALRGRGVRVLLSSLFLIGIAIAAVEIAVAAFAGGETKAALMLALWGVGSLIGGLVAARWPAPPDPPARLAALLVALAFLTTPLALAGDLVGLGALMVLAGLAISPALATAFGLLGQVAPAGTVTEAYTMVATGFGGGIALGSAAGGWLVESAGTSQAFLLAAVAIGLSAIAVNAGRAALRLPQAATAAA